MSKKRKVYERKLQDNLLLLEFHYLPTDFLGGKRDSDAIYAPSFNSIILFARAFRKDTFNDELIDLVIEIIVHENIHKVLYNTLSPEEWGLLRFRMGEEDAVRELETI